MEGFWFYWSLWLIIIAIFFFYVNSISRTKWLLAAFIIMISANFTLSLSMITIKLPIIGIGLLSFSYIARLKLKDMFYTYFVVTLISGLFLLFHYFIYFEPVWLYISPLISITSLSIIVVILFVKNNLNRLSIVCSGFIQGEVVLFLMLLEQSHIAAASYILGDFFFLDVLAISMISLLCWNRIEYYMGELGSKWNTSMFVKNQKSHRKINA
ncbi:YphA family membrane protein [Evansella cellulosilytica]|uniref:Uncharacterized protein n=1 Tax=Evansella cellulosilytica (strain ATCC 21833 / DSM 2522 / FERM P-1141 / JCM 9156 / N-4) TaxID=649639 RepID=E6TZE2_EVAC2|nr:hypothetical protein [Evansella cellulosilytica]ADU30116.1 hypothetical protein Bcell_1854 [Evansella cellulosilytica DSM 2522]